MTENIQELNDLDVRATCDRASLIKKYSSTSYLGMAQVQNGRLYIRYRSNSPKKKESRGVKKANRLHHFAILLLNLPLKLR